MKRKVKNIKEKKSHVLAKKKDFKKREHTLSTKKKKGIQEKTINDQENRRKEMENAN